MRFGLNVSTSAAPGRDPVREAQSAEALGFDFVSTTDHLHGVSPTYETWTMLAWMAAGTSRIGVATRVLGLPYRSPTVLAKMAETFDRLSGGRLILGLGHATPDRQRLLTFAGMGFDTLNLIVAGDDQSEQTRRIADEVIPAVRSAAFDRVVPTPGTARRSGG